MSGMNRRQFLKTTSVAAAAGLLGCQGVESFAKKGANKPLNVLFIMTDQHNANALGCYGSSEVKTPNLNKIAKKGVRFENAFCQTGQCCPSRYSIWTGRYARSHGLRWNCVMDNPEEITIGEIFKDAGYSTATIGKHHMQISPVHHGFEHVVGYPEYEQFIKTEGVEHSWYSGDWLEFHERFGLPAGISHADNEHHTAGFWASEAIEYLKSHKEKPFCMWLSFFGPHMPYVASKPFMDMYDTDSLTLPPNFDDAREHIPEELKVLRANYDDLTEHQMKEVLQCYYAYTSQIDHNIGRVLDELERLGLADNTLIVYTADHGDMMGEHRAFRKAVFNYEGTVRVPLIISLPKKLPSGTAVNELAGLIDLLPTICELAGQQYPNNVQGESLIPIMQNRPVKWRDVIFSEIGYPSPFPTGVCYIARTLDYKYIPHDNHGKPMEELFDLRNDKWETVNQASNPEYAATLTSMRKKLEKWKQNTEEAPLFPIVPWKQGLAPEDFKGEA